MCVWLRRGQLEIKCPFCGVTASLNGFRTSERKKTAVTGANVHGGITASLNGAGAVEQKK